MNMDGVSKSFVKPLVKDAERVRRAVHIKPQFRRGHGIGYILTMRFHRGVVDSQAVFVVLKKYNGTSDDKYQAGDDDDKESKCHQIGEQFSSEESQKHWID